ncbi:MAG: ClbS/DfsB family four-helix bundle protein [Anaerolineales bacterium]|nr:ClbS/DfsB family four-helix bundle protein [Anaerolineales bacterium]MCB8954512.1 ClbS/DfsB family four-helix bundle protein [Ardenticatenales bacterium]
MSEQITKMSKAEMLHRMAQERARLEAALAALTPAQMLLPGVEADWSVKDILAHIVSWEMFMHQGITAAWRGETPHTLQTDAEVDQMNAAFFRENKDRALDDVLAAFADAYEQSRRMVLDTPDADLMEAERFPWRQGRPLWLLVGGNTWWHYEEHRQSIERWLAQNQGA